MKLIYKGKTKDVFDKGDGNYLLKFKDDVTGTDGVFDPGANTVGLSIEGAGRAGLRLTKFFFEKINDAGIPTHFVDCDIENAVMTVKPAQVFGKGLEDFTIQSCRKLLNGTESIAKRRRADAYVEVTLKDDDRNDPLITDEALEMLDMSKRVWYIADLTRKIGAIVKEELARAVWNLRHHLNRPRRRRHRHIALIDEISGGNMRLS